MKDTLDILGAVLWCGMFVTPFITIPGMYYLTKSKWQALLLGGFLAVLFSAILYGLSIAIIFRDGMGP